MNCTFAVVIIYHVLISEEQPCNADMLETSLQMRRIGRDRTVNSTQTLIRPHPTAR
jgi:hypothetical protein